jgi:DNA-binding NarL/FixJ family response regulator
MSNVTQAVRMNVVIVGASEIVLRGHQNALQEGCDNLGSVITSTDPESIEALVRSERPDLLLVDIALLGGDPCRISNVASDPDAQCRILLYAVSGGATIVRRAFDCGVDGIISINASADELCSAACAVVEGTRYVDQALFDRDVELGTQPLTDLEYDVLRLLAYGWSNGVIARELNTTPDIVSTNLTRLLAKLGAANRTEAVVCAMRAGLLQ